MAPSKIQWRASTRKDLRKLPPQAVAQIVVAVEQLAQEPFPHGAEKLSGSEHT
jgi:mRNA interferase RelE/StbE